MNSELWNEAYQEDPEQVEVADFFLEDEIRDLPVGAALDLGCGAGSNALKLAARGWSVTGVDWAEHAVQLANATAQEQKLDATFLVGDTTDWEPPATFDLVISTYALPGGAASAQVMQTAMRALAPGGVLIVAEWDRSMSDVWQFSADELHSPDQIAGWLSGLVIEKAEVRHVAHAFPADDPRAYAGQSANVAFVRARKPQR